MKPLLTLWLSQWLTDPQLSSWVKASWCNTLDIVPEVGSVDDVIPPPAVIYFPPPPKVLVQAEGGGINGRFR